MKKAATYDLAELPEGSSLRSVTAVPAEVGGRKALRVELTDAITFDGAPGVDYVDMPTFVIIPVNFLNGTSGLIDSVYRPCCPQL